MYPSLFGSKDALTLSLIKTVYEVAELASSYTLMFETPVLLKLVISHGFLS